YVDAPSTYRRFLARGGSPGPASRTFAEAWIRLLNPITPHLSEELGAGRFEGLVSAGRFPDADAFRPSERVEASEHFLERVEEALRDVLKPAAARGESRWGVALFVAAGWKRTIEEWMR